MTAPDITPSHGPDPCHGNLNCRDYHDELGRLPEEITRLYNCCCCDPCHYVRPNVLENTDKPVPSRYCCRCVPRGFYISFLPDDPENPCCNEYLQPVFVEQEAESYLAIYRGSLFGVSVEVTLGRDEDDACLWHVQASQGGYPIFDETYAVDHEQTSCLQVPLEMEIEGVEGPKECQGKIVLEDFRRAKLPFRYKFDGPRSWWPNPEDFTLQPWTNFADLYPACGECGQVCRAICVKGVRHENGDFEHVTFTWAEYPDGRRGWYYDPPDGSPIEWMWLEVDPDDPYGACQIRPELEAGERAEIFPPLAIDTESGCSCGLYEIFPSTLGGDDPPVFSARCGDCSCWVLYCGACRCMPREMCVLVVAELTATRQVLEWDREHFRWGGDSDSVRLYLSWNAVGQCVVRPEVDGYYAIDAEAVISCEEESASNQFNPASDVLSFELEDADQAILIIASSLRQDCARGVCDEATPCNDDCGGHPQSLTINFRLWSEPGDTSGYPVDCDVDVVVHFWETADYYLPGEGVKYSCGYVGWLLMGDPCCTVKVVLRAGTVSFYTPLGLDDSDCAAQPAIDFELTEDCDPYYGDSGELLDVPSLDWRCLGCADSTGCRTRVTVTE
jgi:hypothetical protein